MKVEQLVAWELLTRVGEVIPATEERVGLAITTKWARKPTRPNPLFVFPAQAMSHPDSDHAADTAMPASVEADVDPWRDLLAILRTGGLFVLGSEDVSAIIASEKPTIQFEDGTEDIPHFGWADHLPPLPYPRVWIEFAGDHLAALPPMGDRAEPVPAIGYGLLDHSDGWIVFAVLRPDGIDGPVLSTHWLPRHPDSPLIMSRKWFWTVTPLLVEIIDALGARRDHFPLPRSYRRDLERRYGPGHPSIYFVDLAQAGDQPAPGRGDREYRHRWLVRGHYRANDAGRFFVPGKGQCSWVRPYVKGPKGAPWKGRPIYRHGTVASGARLQYDLGR